MLVLRWFLLLLYLITMPIFATPQWLIFLSFLFAFSFHFVHTFLTFRYLFLPCFIAFIFEFLEPFIVISNELLVSCHVSPGMVVRVRTISTLTTRS